MKYRIHVIENACNIKEHKRGRDVTLGQLPHCTIGDPPKKLESHFFVNKKEDVKM